MRWISTLGLMASLGGALQADWKIATVTKSTCWQSIETEYYKGALRRTDWSDENGDHKHVEVLDHGNRRFTVWDFDSRQYTVHRFARPRPAPAPLPPSAVITIDRATTDTGERRPFFGRTARHLITRERRGGSDAETVIDGWYIDSEGLPRERHDAVLVIGSAYGPPVLKVNQTGPKPTGLAVLLKNSSTYEETTREVTELVEGPLTDDLFEPPPGFVHGIRFPDHFRQTWEWLQDWVASLFP